MIDKRISETIRLTVLFATITVVVRHSFNMHIYQPSILNIGPYDINSLVQLVNRHCTASAVPTFFLLSGYLFFCTLREKGMIRKWTSRFHSLVVPYIAWNSLHLVFLLILPHIAFARSFTTREPLTFSLHTMISRLTIHPAAGHFWYVRDLMAFVIGAPLFCLIYRQRWLASMVLVSLLLFWRPVDCSVLSSEGLFFFFLGGWVGDRQLDIKYLRIESPWFSGAIFLLWLGLCVCQTLWPLHGFYRQFAAKLSILMGVMLLWLLADRVNNLRVRKGLFRLVSYGFFIYALHAPMIRGIYKILLSLKPEDQHYGLLVYMVTPVITITICVLTAKVIARGSGQLFSVLTGRRVRVQNNDNVTQPITQPTCCGT